MRISIWRQHSGNHSSGFTMVGDFKTADEAQAAAAALNQLLRDLAAWAESTEGRRWAGASREPRPPEIELGAEYGFSWPQPFVRQNSCPWHAKIGRRSPSL